MTDDPSKRSGLADSVRTIGALSTVGFSFVLAIMIGAGAGYLLMTRFGLGSWVFFLGFALGVVAGILNVYRAAGRFLK
ncbi:MAG: AtpZ/AtpI family protein [Vicinamibacterales bacterium]